MLGKGSVLLVISFAMAIAIIGTRLHSLEKRAILNMSYYYDVTTSHNLASAGANVGLSIFSQDTSKRGTIVSKTYTSGMFKGGSMLVTMTDLGTQFRLRSLSSYKNTYRDTVEVYLNKVDTNSFSLFAWMTDAEGNVFWITGDTVWGRVHSNGSFHIDGSPVFWKKATTTKNIDPKPGVGTSKGIYKDGYETGVDSIRFPTDISKIVAASTSGGRKYTSDIWITLSGGTTADNNGKAYIRTSASGTIVDSVSLSDPSFNGAIYTTGNAYVKGTVDGRLTIGANNNITVLDDIVYEKSPLVDSTTTDLLGLVSNNDVIVAENTANNTNCEIDACIFARTGSFKAENYEGRPVSGVLKVIGSIVQRTRGGVGTFNTGHGTLKSGFSKRYYYDNRLANNDCRPPFYPGYLRYVPNIVGWWENIRIPDTTFGF
jgi:hypothetical protein